MQCIFPESWTMKMKKRYKVFSETSITILMSQNSSQGSIFLTHVFLMHWVKCYADGSALLIEAKGFRVALAVIHNFVVILSSTSIVYKLNDTSHTPDLSQLKLLLRVFFSSYDKKKKIKWWKCHIDQSDVFNMEPNLNFPSSIFTYLNAKCFPCLFLVKLPLAVTVGGNVQRQNQNHEGKTEHLSASKILPAIIQVY